MQKGHRRSNRRLKFNLSTEKPAGSDVLTLVGLIAGMALFCGALLFAFNQGRAPIEPAGVAGKRGSTMQPVDAGQRGNQGASKQSALAERDQSEKVFQGEFRKCGRVRINCVVDGDTIWLAGQKIRIADIDTPEISRPKCREEYLRGMAATRRLIELLNQGAFTVTASEWGDEDRFGRKLRLIVRQRASLGERLIGEGLAHRWDGRKRSWCDPR